MTKKNRSRRQKEGHPSAGPVEIAANRAEMSRKPPTLAAKVWFLGAILLETTWLALLFILGLQ